MLPRAISGSLDRLGQPCLLRPISDKALTGEGLPRPDLLSGIDRLLIEHASREAADFAIPHRLPCPVAYGDRWRLVSSLQKAIRRGDIAAATVAALACYEVDDRYLWRRLVVIAVEDVLLGNLYAVALTLALAGNRRAREDLGGARAATWIAAQLAGGLKDRSACNLCVLVDLNRQLNGRMEMWKHRPDDMLAVFASELDRPIEHRMLAAWLLAGTKRFWNINVPTDNDRPRWSLMRLMAESRMPLILYWIADRAAVRGGGCMFVATLPLWQELERAQDQDFTVRTEAITGQQRFGPILAPAYDMHTREGRRALRQFGELPAVADALSSTTCSKTRFDLLCEAVFAVEGGKLDRRLSAAVIDHCHERAAALPLSYFGLPRAQQQAQLLCTVGSTLPRLSDLRAKAIAAERPGDPFGSVDFQALLRPPLMASSTTPSQLDLKL